MRWEEPFLTTTTTKLGRGLSYGGCIDISTMYLRHWKPPGVSERMWSVNLDPSFSGEYQTRGGHQQQL